MTDSRIGSDLAGYRIESLLGRGGMSVVYLATDSRLERKVALKLLAPELAEQTGFRERFIRESRLAASIDHPNVIPVFEAGQAEDLLFIAMRYVRGTDLRAELEREGPLEPGRVVAIVGQVAAALDAAHREGLVHRDVKPANVLLVPPEEPGAREHVYLSDFGVTKRRLSAGGLTATGQLVGTVDYVAPEQIKGEAVDGRADVYSLGCMAFQCLTGRPPFEGDTEVAVLWAQVQTPPPSATNLRPELPAAVDRVLGRAMAKSPDERPPTAGGFARDLADVLETKPAAVAGRPPAGGKRRRRLVAVGVGALIVLAGTALAFALTRADESPTVTTSPSTGAVSGNLFTIDLASAKLTKGITIPSGSQSSGGQGSIATGQGFVWAAARNGLVKLNPQGVVLDTLTEVLAQFGTVAAGDEGVWVAAGAFRPDQLTVSHVDPRTNRVVAGRQVPGGDVAGGAALVLSGTPIAVGEGSAWVVDHDNHRLLRIDPGTNRVAARIDVPSSPDGVAAGDGSVWVRHNGVVASVMRVDPATNRVLSTIQLPAGADGMAVGNGSVWVTDTTNDTLIKLDPATNSISTTIRVGRNPQAVVVDDQGDVWVYNSGDSTVSKVDGGTGRVVAVVAVPLHTPAGASLPRRGLAAGFGSLWVT